MLKQFILSGILGLSAISACFAVPEAFFTPSKSDGLTVIDNPDGRFSRIEKFGKDVIINSNDNHYIYFKIDPDVRPSKGSDVWLLVEFFDDKLGEIEIEYTSAVKNYDKIFAIQMGLGNKWDTALIKLPNTYFQGIQNGGSDFRFNTTGTITVSSVAFYKEKPDLKTTTNEERVAGISAAVMNLPQNGKPGKGMRYVYGDNSFEVTAPERRYETPFGGNRNDATIKLYKSLGATSVETYVTWETCEKDGYGKWDWRLWDKQFDVLKANDMKWTPFLIVGPAYSIPNWFREREDHFPCRCLEHGTDSKIESLWNPNLKKWITRFLTEFAKRYDKDEILESILVGIQGDYGEAIYSVFGGWTQNIPGDYHAHRGFWCDDKYALADYRSFMKNKYKSIDLVNTSWGTDIKSFDTLDFPARGDAFIEFEKKTASGNPAEARQWLDFVEWYRASMTGLSDWWLAETKRIFPNTAVYLCTGGHGDPAHGSDFSEQCRVAAKNNCGVRITNEGPGYQWNNVLTRLVASSGRFYGATFGFEPAANIDTRTIPGRIYNATISGSDHLHDYSRNIISSNEKMDVQRKAFKYLMKTKPVIPTALWYPNVAMTLNNPVEFGKFSNGSAKLREYVDHDYVDENMLRDGALRKYKILLINNGGVMETSDAKMISQWVKRGGTAIVMDKELFVSVEGTSEPENILFGGKQGKGKIIRAENYKEMADIIADVMEKYGYPIFDMKEDGLYASQISKTELLYLNTTDFNLPAYITIKGKTARVEIPELGITKIDMDELEF